MRLLLKRRELLYQFDVRGYILNHRVSGSSGGVSLSDAAVVTVSDMIDRYASLCLLEQDKVNGHQEIMEIYTHVYHLFHYKNS